MTINYKKRNLFLLLILILCFFSIFQYGNNTLNAQAEENSTSYGEFKCLIVDEENPSRTIRIYVNETNSGIYVFTYKHTDARYCFKQEDKVTNSINDNSIAIRYFNEYTGVVTNNNINSEENKEPDPLGIKSAISNSISSIFLKITIQLCGLIDLVLNLFHQLVGLDTVNINGSDQNLITYFLTDKSVQNSLIIIMAIAFFMTLVFMIIQYIRGVAHSEDAKFNPRRTFENSIRALVNIILVPIIVVVGVFFANTIVGEVNTGMQASTTSQVFENQNDRISYGGEMLLMMATDQKDRNKLLYGSEKYAGHEKYSDDSIIKYNKKSNNGMYPNFKYMNISNWQNEEGLYYIPYEHMNIIVAFIGSICLLVVLILCSFTFIKRIFEILLLYIVSPLLIATTPIDQGKRFENWRNLLISKVLSAYGVILTVNLYFMIVPIIIIAPGVIFFGGNNNNIANSVVQLLFVIGGAFALNGASLLFSQLLGTGTQESQSNAQMGRTLTSMVRAGAGVGFAGLKMAGKFGGKTAGFTAGTVLHGSEFAGRAFNASKFGRAINQAKYMATGKQSFLTQANNGLNLKANENGNAMSSIKNNTPNNNVPGNKRNANISSNYIPPNQQSLDSNNSITNSSNDGIINRVPSKDISNSNSLLENYGNTKSNMQAKKTAYSATNDFKTNLKNIKRNNPNISNANAKKQAYNLTTNQLSNYKKANNVFKKGIIGNLQAMSNVRDINKLNKYAQRYVKINK